MDKPVKLVPLDIFTYLSDLFYSLVPLLNSDVFIHLLDNFIGTSAGFW